MKSLSLPKSLVPALLALITLHFATSTSATVPTSAQMKSAMSPFEFLKNVKTSDLKSVGGTRQARFKMGGEETTLVGYIPNGSRRVILGLVTRKAAIGKFIGGSLAGVQVMVGPVWTAFHSICRKPRKPPCP